MLLNWSKIIYNNIKVELMWKKTRDTLDQIDRSNSTTSAYPGIGQFDIPNGSWIHFQSQEA